MDSRKPSESVTNFTNQRPSDQNFGRMRSSASSNAHEPLGRNLNMLEENKQAKNVVSFANLRHSNDNAGLGGAKNPPPS